MVMLHRFLAFSIGCNVENNVEYWQWPMANGFYLKISVESNHAYPKLSYVNREYPQNAIKP